MFEVGKYYKSAKDAIYYVEREVTLDELRGNCAVEWKFLPKAPLWVYKKSSSGTFTQDGWRDAISGRNELKDMSMEDKNQLLPDEVDVEGNPLTAGKMYSEAIPHTRLIHKAAIGEEIQVKINNDWISLFTSPQEAITAMLEEPEKEFRVKPPVAIRWLFLGKDQNGNVVTDGILRLAGHINPESKSYNKILRIDIDPDTLDIAKTVLQDCNNGEKT